MSEILYHAKISPDRKVENLNESDRKQLLKSIKSIFKYSYETNLTGYNEDMDIVEQKYILEARKNNKNIANNITNFKKIPENITRNKKPFGYKVYRKKYDPNKNQIKKFKTKTNRFIYYSIDQI